MAQITDQLATGRSHLANERTLLAYVRTALTLAATGAVLPKLVAHHPALSILIWILVGSGLIAAAIGVRRFVTVRRQIKAVGRES